MPFAIDTEKKQPNIDTYFKETNLRFFLEELVALQVMRKHENTN